MREPRLDTDRLQAMLNYANAKALAEDCIHRLDIRTEVAGLDNARRIHILECWGGDQC